MPERLTRSPGRAFGYGRQPALPCDLSAPRAAAAGAVLVKSGPLAATAENGELAHSAHQARRTPQRPRAYGYEYVFSVFTAAAGLPRS
jgi:hypothetical protein